MSELVSANPVSPSDVEGGGLDALDLYLEDVKRVHVGKLIDLPEFSRYDGRVEARVLLLFQDPGRSGAAVSGVVDRGNDDPSAKAIRETEDVLPRETTVSWNAIPWAQRGTVSEELMEVRRWELVPRLLDALPEARVAILCGGVAHMLTVDVYEYAHRSGRDILVLHGPHPSNRGLNDRWFGRGARKRWLRKVMEQAHDHVSPRGDG